MQSVLKTLLIVACATLGASLATAEPGKRDLENMIYLDLKSGRVAIKLRPDIAPKHVARIKKLARQGFYDGLTFHRVIEGFMAQTGDPTGTGRGGSKLGTLPAEFSNESFKRGTVGAARKGGNNDSANSQFFICFKAAPWLNGKYTIFGEVVKGMSHVDQIKKGRPRSGTVDAPDRIVRMQVAADAKDHSVLKN